MIKTFENRDKLIEKYRDTIDYVTEHNGSVDIFVAFEMLVANAFRNADYEVPEDFSTSEFKADYEELFGVR